MDILQQVDESSVVLRCLIRQLTPFGPQTAFRQAQLFHQYVQILQKYQLRLQSDPIMPISTEFGMITSGGLANFEWVKPFIDCTTVATFPGLALSEMAYGSTSQEKCQTRLQTFSGPKEGGQAEEQSLPLPDDGTHAVFPSKPCHVQIWDELRQILTDVLSKECANYSHFGLFSNQFTDNAKPSLLPSGESFFVRLGLQNPFPFQLVLRNLCLSLDQLKLRPGCSPPFSDKFRCSIVSELVFSPLDLDERPSEKVLKKHFVDLHVLPGPELEQFSVNGIKFDLCSPVHFNGSADEIDHSAEIASVSAFFPLSVRGKRLFKTKEQRMSTQYAMDKRLSATVCSDSVPLLSFRPVGGDPGFIKAVTHWHPLEAFCDQIVQIVFEIENVGKNEVEQLRFCTNFAERVSISEPSDGAETVGRWTQCPSKGMPTAFTDDASVAGEFGMEAANVGQFGKISKECPLSVGEKIGLRVAIRVQQKPQTFYFLFLYFDRNGRCRQFRFSARVRPLSRIFDADHCVLSGSIGLSMLTLRCLPFNSHETAVTLTKLDLLRLSVKVTDGNARTNVRRVDNEPIQLENATEQNLCFYMANEEATDGQRVPTPAAPSVPKGDGAGWADIWLGKTYVPDFPEWKIMARSFEKKAEIIGSEQHSNALQMKLLWKASLIRGDGTVSNVFGELLKQSVIE
ncbi:hypothetical protein niasHT_017057 [Heterodera trifolii]|uniref:TPPC8 first Ig-like domain-containing protein n=1 Tax=Heterodera trifolii TaxID=157864 RepID=A0ABD2KXY1_9BILA